MLKPLRTHQSVLIAEDDDDQRDCVCEALVDEGFNVETATNGKSALQALLKGKHDLAILDLRMPGMDGRAVLRELRKHEQDQEHIPVIVLSAFIDYDRANYLVSAGANLALSKPVAINDLLMEVHRLTD